MARPTVGKKPMTDAERQRRRRKRLAREGATAARQVKAARARQKEAEHYIPTPPGVTFWEKAEIVTDSGLRTVWTPTTKRLAACGSMLTDDDVRALLDQISEMASERGVEARARPLGLTGMGVLKHREDEPEGVRLRVSRRTDF